MTVEEFVNNYENKKVDFDGFYGAQCVDLFRQYVKEVLNIKEHTGAVAGAKDLYNNFDKMPLMQKNFSKVYGARKGDIAIFGNGQFGHVGIVLFASRKNIVLFEQDGFNQSKGAYIGIHNYENVLGFLRRK